MWFYRETIGFFLFMRGVLSRRVEWRSGVYRLRFGGCGVRIEDEKPASKSNSNSSMENKTKSALVEKNSSQSRDIHKIDIVNENMYICSKKVYAYSSSLPDMTKTKNTKSSNHVRTFSV